MLFSNNNNNRAGQSLKAIAKSAYAITDRTQRNYLAKMQTVRKATQNRLAHHDQPTLQHHPSSPITLKQQWDIFVKELFDKLDFDKAGFISSSKIAHNKAMTETVFYFFGGVFQKVRQMGAVTQKMFISLTDELFIQVKATDIEQLLAGNISPSLYIPLKRKKGKSTKHSTSYTHTNRSLRIDSSRHGLTLTESSINNNTLPKKSSLKLHLQSIHKEQTKEVKRGRDSNFDSIRVRQLSERLDRQIAHSQTRITLNKLLR